MILGNFATKYIYKLSDAEINLYENFINEKDWDIYGWVTGSLELPKEHDNEVVRRILEEKV